jgi:hypothetical protein
MLRPYKLEVFIRDSVSGRYLSFAGDNDLAGFLRRKHERLALLISIVVEVDFER